MVCLVNAPYIDKNEAAPMFQLALETRLLRFTQEAPTSKPLLQLPPTIALRATSYALHAHQIP